MGRPKVYDELLREKLINEAHRMLSDDGYNSVSLRILAKNAGTSTNAVYTLFGSKEALMTEAINAELDKKMPTSSFDGTENEPWTNLFQVVMYYRLLALNTPHIFANVFAVATESRRAAIPAGRNSANSGRIEEKILAPLQEACRRVIESENATNINADQMALNLWSLVHGLISLESSGLLCDFVQDIAQLYLQSLHCFRLGWMNPSATTIPEFTLP